MPKFRMTRGLVALFAAVALVLILVTVGLQLRAQPQQVDLSTLLSDVKADVAVHHVDTLTIDSSSLTLDRGHGVVVQTGIGPGFSLADTLKRDTGVPYNDPHVLKVAYVQPGVWSSAGSYLISLLLICSGVGLLFYFMRRGQGMNNPAASFGKSRARMFAEDKPSTTFTEVAGVDEAKQELEE